MPQSGSSASSCRISLASTPVAHPHVQPWKGTDKLPPGILLTISSYPVGLWRHDARPVAREEAKRDTRRSTAEAHLRGRIT